MSPFVRCVTAAVLLHAPAVGAGPAGAKTLVAAQVLEPAVSGEGAIADRFGRSLAWSNDTLLVAATGDEVTGPALPGVHTSGSVSVYRETAAGFTFEALLLPSMFSGDDRFGLALAIAGDLVAIGAPFEDDEVHADRGAVYVFERSGTGWSEIARLIAPDGDESDQFGYSVAIDSGGLVVGAPRAVSGQGRVYHYTRAGASYTLSATLEAGLPGDEVGRSVALGADAIFAGAPRSQVGTAADAGVVFCFARAGGSCASPAIAAAAPSASARFGTALALQGTRLVVGAPGETVGAELRRGAAYVFDATAITPALQRDRMLGAGGDGDDEFGSSLAIDGATLAVGAPGAFAAEGAAFVFVAFGNNWVQQQSFSEPDGGLLDLYGAAVALHGDRLAIGVELDNLAPNRAQGSVATFIRDGTTWTPGVRLATGDGASREQFGTSVAIDATVAIVGSPLDDPAIDQDDAGTASVYGFDGAAWLREARLEAGDGFTEDLFGYAVDASDQRVLVGAPRAIIAGRLDQGAAYVFRRDPTGWVEEAKLVAPDGLGDNFFGSAVSLDGDLALVGAPFRDGASPEEGGGYVFRRTGTTWAFEAQLVSTAFSQLGAAGLSVAIDGDLAVLGAPDGSLPEKPFHGVAHVFVRDGGTWRAGLALAAADGSEGDAFGSAVALDGTDLVVGAAQDVEAMLANAGSAYVYALSPDGNAAALVQRLVAPQPSRNSFFGEAVAVSQGRALVGNIGDDEGAANAGAALYYERSGSLWSFRTKLQAAQPQRQALFGDSVALSPLGGIVGEPLRDRMNPDEGAAHLYFDDRLFNDGFE